KESVSAALAVKIYSATFHATRHAYVSWMRLPLLNHSITPVERLASDCHLA
ncbi:MAG: hypothetical protein RLZZ291_303, partial [Actinomycetota bacterium]